VSRAFPGLNKACSNSQFVKMFAKGSNTLDEARFARFSSEFGMPSKRRPPRVGGALPAQKFSDVGRAARPSIVCP
jgi:hypothetical protein